MLKKFEVIIVGGGVIGCSIAYHLARAGKRVLVLEKNKVGSEASSAAAGMLGVQSELQEWTPLYELARRSRELFPELSKELKSFTGIDISYRKSGALKIALTGEDLNELQTTATWQTTHGETVEYLSRHETIAHEPGLSDDIKGALYFPNEAQVSSSQLVRAFAAGVAYYGSKIEEQQEVLEIITDQRNVQGVRTFKGDYFADHVIVASGVWSNHPAFAQESNINLFPIKGEALSLNVSTPILSRTIFSEACYLTPKTADEIYVGATEQPHTYDKKPTVNGIYQLLGAARNILPAIGSAKLKNVWAGLRPATTTRHPYIGKAPTADNLWYAFGHHRNGVLLSAITGDVTARLINGESIDFDIAPFSPDQQLLRSEPL